MKLVDDEIRRRFSLHDTTDGRSERPKRLMMVLSTIQEMHGPMYARMGYVVDYAVRQDKDPSGGEREFHIAHMSRYMNVDG